jgi:hypothetical protein
MAMNVEQFDGNSTVKSLLDGISQKDENNTTTGVNVSSYQFTKGKRKNKIK